MENIVLTVHLLLAVALIALVLLQRSEGGGLGMGGGGGGVMTGRQAANAMTRLTWLLAVAFLITSLILTVMAARNTSTGSVLDQLDIGAPQMPAPASQSNMPELPAYVPPPPAAGQPITPPAPQAPAAQAPESQPPATQPPEPEAPAAGTTPAPAPASGAPQAPAAQPPGN